MLRHAISNQTPSRCRCVGLTLAESLLAMTILSVIVTAILQATVAGHQHLNQSTHRLDACRLAEQLLEEVNARPYDGAGTARHDFHIADYHGLDEGSGELRDASGALLPVTRQGFHRTASIIDDTAQLVGLDAHPTPIRIVSVRVRVNRDRGTDVTFTSLVAEPLSP